MEQLEVNALPAAYSSKSAQSSETMLSKLVTFHYITWVGDSFL